VDEMIAKDRERVPLKEPFTMEGEVENYLNQLTDVVATTLRLNMEEGIDTAVNWEVEKPRDQWLFDYPAQIVLTGEKIRVEDIVSFSPQQ